MKNLDPKTKYIIIYSTKASTEFRVLDSYEEARRLAELMCAQYYRIYAAKLVEEDRINETK